MRIGKCKRCGNCCKGSTVIVGSEKEVYAYLIETGLSRKEARMQVRRLRGHSCRHLKFEGEKAVCDIYSGRPWFCKEFPLEKKDVVMGCGFEFVGDIRKEETDV